MIALVFSCTCSHLFSQQANDALLDKFRDYSGKAIQEKLYLHTDKEFYVAGEIAWFRLYYTDGLTHHPLQMSKVAYVEILNDKNDPVQQAKISLIPGESKGSFYLPASLNTGYYTIRAYTNWMKNFDNGFFFEKRVAIVNTLKEPGAGSATATATAAVIQFFPEGGNLVSDLESRVGFIIRNANGGINEAKGFIVSNANDTILAFSPLKFGIGNFLFKPQAGNTYKAIVVLPGGPSITQSLPQVYNDGYVMRLDDSGAGQLLLNISMKVNGAQQSEQLMLAVHTRQSLKLAERLTVNNSGSVSVAIDKSKLGDGVTHLTLFNQSGRPVCERLYFIKPAQNASLSVSSDRAVYETRQPISLSLNALSGTAPDLSMEMSASVFLLDSLQEASQSSIVDYMWLTSDLGDDIESPGYYFSNDKDVSATTDNLMLTHGWRRFKWEDVLQGGEAFIKYMPELNGHLVTGVVRDKRTGLTAPDVDAYLSISGQPFGFYTAKSDKNGIVRFEVKRYYGNSQVITQPGIGEDSFYQVELQKPFVNRTVTGDRQYVLSEAIKDQLLRKSIGMQVQNIYSGDSLKNFSDPFLDDTLPFYGRPETTYMLDDYKRFTTMEEVLREYVREIGVGARHEQLIFKIFNPVAHDFYDGNALVLLDGVAITNPNKIFTYDPLKIKKIDVIRDRYVMGLSTFNGVASFSTYEGMFDGFELDPGLVAVDYSGLQMQREFYSPVYATREQFQNRIPDFRNTLYWNGEVQTDKDGKAKLQFYSSDLKGKYLVVVQGMNDTGGFVSATATFEVK